MKLEEFKSGRKTFRATKDKIIVSKILDIIKQFNLKNEAPTTRQISNVYHKVQTIEESLIAVDKEQMPTNIQDSILQGILNPLLASRKLQSCFGQGNSKCWKLPDEILKRLDKQASEKLLKK